MTKKISSIKPCGRNIKIENGAFIKCFSIDNSQLRLVYDSYSPFLFQVSLHYFKKINTVFTTNDDTNYTGNSCKLVTLF